MVAGEHGDGAAGRPVVVEHRSLGRGCTLTVLITILISCTAMTVVLLLLPEVETSERWLVVLWFSMGWSTCAYVLVRTTVALRLDEHTLERTGLLWNESIPISDITKVRPSWLYQGGALVFERADGRSILVHLYGRLGRRSNLLPLLDELQRRRPDLEVRTGPSGRLLRWWQQGPPTTGAR